MTTNGFVGMVHGGQTLAVYNTYDSYPDNLGIKTILFAMANLKWIDTVADRFFALPRVHQLEGATDSDPEARTAEQMAELEGAVGGDLGACLNAGVLPVLFDVPVSDVDENNVDVEWGYLINVDTRAIEIYKMFDDSSQPLSLAFDDLDSAPPRILIQFLSLLQEELDDGEGTLPESFTMDDMLERYEILS